MFNRFFGIVSVFVLVVGMACSSSDNNDPAKDQGTSSDWGLSDSTLTDGSTPTDGSVIVNKECIIYVGPNGTETASGRTPEDPTNLLIATQERSYPGDVVCLLPGTYKLTEVVSFGRAGTESSPIILRPYQPNQAVILEWAGDVAEGELFYFGETIPNEFVKYIELIGIKLDGKNKLATGISCGGASHIKIVGNTITGFGSSGITLDGCNYMTVDGNKIFKNGFNQGQGNGIVVGGAVDPGTDKGFHIAVINNIIAGNSDGSATGTEGNGILIDGTGDKKAPILVANNLVYMNAGQGIVLGQTKDAWVVNNTAYKNGLNQAHAEAAEYYLDNNQTIHFINNIAYGWEWKSATNSRYGIIEENNLTSDYAKNIFFNTNNLLPVAISNDLEKVKPMDPEFTNALSVDGNTDKQWEKAANPTTINTQFTLKSSSQAIDAGKDPGTTAGISQEIKDGLEKYLSVDLAGGSRPKGDGFDIGAYEAN